MIENKLVICQRLSTFLSKSLQNTNILFKRYVSSIQIRWKLECKHNSILFPNNIYQHNSRPYVGRNKNLQNQPIHTTRLKHQNTNNIPSCMSWYQQSSDARTNEIQIRRLLCRPFKDHKQIYGRWPQTCRKSCIWRSLFVRFTSGDADVPGQLKNWTNGPIAASCESQDVWTRM